MPGSVTYSLPCITTPSPLPSPFLSVKLNSSAVPLKPWNMGWKKWKQHDNAIGFTVDNHPSVVGSHNVLSAALHFPSSSNLQNSSRTLSLLFFSPQTLILSPISVFNFNDKTEKSSENSILISSAKPPKYLYSYFSAFLEVPMSDLFLIILKAN